MTCRRDLTSLAVFSFGGRRLMNGVEMDRRRREEDAGVSIEIVSRRIQDVKHKM